MSNAFAGIVMFLSHGHGVMRPERWLARVEWFLKISSDNPDIFPEKK